MKFSPIFLFLFLLVSTSIILLTPFVLAQFGFENPFLPQLSEELFDGKPSKFYMPNNKSVFGNFSFNQGWENGGLSIIDGDIYAQTGFFLNITSLNVTKQNLTINENLFVVGNLGVGTTTPESMFTIADSVAVPPIDDFSKYQILIHSTGINAARSYGMGTESGTMWFNTDDTYKFYRDGSNVDMILKAGNMGIGTTTPQNKLNVIGDGNFTGDFIIGGNFTTPNGGIIWDNATCVFISSPGGTSRLDVCD